MRKFYLAFLVILIFSCVSEEEKFNKDFFEILDEMKYVDTKYFIFKDTLLIYPQLKNKM